ncbi:MAG: hypothetical protein ACRD6N_01855, partial [Pyrinomonadaceae bacterium]
IVNSQSSCLAFIVHRFKPAARTPPVISLPCRSWVGSVGRKSVDHLTLFLIEILPVLQVTFTATRASIIAFHILVSF